MPNTVPAPLRPVESFLNSIDVESDRDDLSDLDRFRRWLGDHGHRGAASTASTADLDLARRLRTELRAEAATHHDGHARDRTALRDLCRAVPLTTVFDDAGVPVPAPAAGGVPGVLGAVLAAVILTAHDGRWRRLKICPADDCRWVYYDASRNSSRRWCSMQVCGNRNKTRAYRQRATAQ